MGPSKWPSGEQPGVRLPKGSRGPGHLVREPLGRAELRVRFLHQAMGHTGRHQALCDGMGGAPRQRSLLPADRRELHDRQWLLALWGGPPLGQEAVKEPPDVLPLLPQQQSRVLPPVYYLPPLCCLSQCTLHTGLHIVQALGLAR